jgi:hypothetical protein
MTNLKSMVNSVTLTRMDGKRLVTFVTMDHEVTELAATIILIFTMV